MLAASEETQFKNEAITLIEQMPVNQLLKDDFIEQIVSIKD